MEEKQNWLPLLMVEADIAAMDSAVEQLGSSS